MLSGVSVLSASVAEGGVWAGVDGEWRRLHGAFESGRASLEWHSFRIERVLEWRRSFHHRSLEICLNFGGRGGLRCGRGEFALGAGEAAVYVTGEAAVAAWRAPPAPHVFATLELSCGFVRECLGEQLLGSALPGVGEFCERDGDTDPAVLWQGRLPAALLGLGQRLVEPPVDYAVRPLWYHAKMIEVCAQLLVGHEWRGELFCERRQRVTRERCEEAYRLLERDCDNPPTLEMLAAEVGWSPSHLSRAFKRHFGVGIAAALRRIRLERAASLLCEGASATEAAFAVGYSSLGSFYKAFAGQFGCSPGGYAERPREAAAGR